MNMWVGVITQYRGNGKNRFKSLSPNTVHGWISSFGKINEKCNKIIIKTQVDAAWQNLIIALSRQ